MQIRNTLQTTAHPANVSTLKNTAVGVVIVRLNAGQNVERRVSRL